MDLGSLYKAAHEISHEAALQAVYEAGHQAGYDKGYTDGVTVLNSLAEDSSLDANQGISDPEESSNPVVPVDQQSDEVNLVQNKESPISQTNKKKKSG